jgi:hypothetical protein
MAHRLPDKARLSEQAAWRREGGCDDERAEEQRANSRLESMPIDRQTIKARPFANLDALSFRRLPPQMLRINPLERLWSTAQ